MLIGRGPKQTSDDLVSLLLACHARIRQFAALTLVIADGTHSPLDEIAEASGRVRRYFIEALPLHVRDEEESIEPRLMGNSTNLDRALEQMKTQHRAHESPLGELIALCTRLCSQPEGLVATQFDLRNVGELLCNAFEFHLKLEETTIFPAIRSCLPHDTQLIIAGEMRARRRESYGG